ncbi:MAG: ABC transporter ATP-binding protein [SAR324 cluster bacterium]|nr:ABC transporter ATP-binding protein [SAR324 cluster bacterium]
MANINVKDMIKRFGQTEVITKLNLEIKDQEFVVLLGPSGCGKTTTLRAIAGLEDIQGGEITIDGKAVHDLPVKQRDIAFVFQLFALYPHLSAFNNIAFPLKAAGMPKSDIEKRVFAVAEFLQIKSLLKSMPSALSGGDLQRVSMARALVRDPKALLMDEPMGTLDAKLREELRTELKHLHIETNSTTVYVTHDQVEAMSMGDKIAVMNDGILQQMGNPKEVYDNPSNIFVAQFIGSPVMNVVDCNYATDGDVTHLVLGENNSDKFTLSKNLTQKLKAKNGDSKNLAVGIRAEAVDLKLEPTKGYVKVEVEVIEPLGPFDIVDVKVGDGLVRSSTRSQYVEKSCKHVWIHLNEEKIHFFDTQSGQSLNINAEA